MARRKTALVIGATGVVGRNLIRHLDGLPDWDIVGVARRPLDFESRARMIAVDLLDRAAARAALGGLKQITHIFYAGYTERPTWAEQEPPNRALLANAFDAVEPVAKNLRQVCLLQGTKYYGSHLGPFKTPAKEDDPRHVGPNFYYSQQDFLTARQKGKAWTWSAMRPHAVCGYNTGTPMNLVSCIAVYAALLREQGIPLKFPGTPGAYRAVYQVTDADLMSRAMVWAATTPACANQAYNITNGDFVRWENLWPRFARHFKMEVGPVQRVDLALMMANQAPLWDRMVKKYRLLPTPFAQVAHWPFANYIFNMGWDMMSDTLKCRQHGFLEFKDTEAMFMEQFDALRRARVVP